MFYVVDRSLLEGRGIHVFNRNKVDMHEGPFPDSHYRIEIVQWADSTMSDTRKYPLHLFDHPASSTAYESSFFVPCG